MLPLLHAREVRRLRWSFRLLLAFAAFHSSVMAQDCSSSKFLDLSIPPPPVKGDYFPVPGFAAGGIAGKDDRQPPRYRLPLEVHLCPPQSVAWRSGEPIALELLIRNVGKVPFDLPSSRTDLTVFQQGETGRRTFFFALRPPGAGLIGSLDQIIVASLRGSSSRPDARIRLLPGESIRVRVAADLPGSAERSPEGASRIDYVVVCWETTLDDDRYFIRAHNISGEVISANWFSVELER